MVTYSEIIKRKADFAEKERNRLNENGLNGTCPTAQCDHKESDHYLTNELGRDLIRCRLDNCMSEI